jgi:Family of unknown function (DUF5681)
VSGADESGAGESDDETPIESVPAKVGHKRPPKGSRFGKGTSGNPKGRPRGRSRTAPYEAVLGQMVTIRDGPVEKRMSAAEAFMLHLAKRGLEGDGPAGRALMTTIEEVSGQTAVAHNMPMTIVHGFVTPGSVNTALEPLRMARKLDPCRPSARMMLEPWIVEAALKRLGDRRLSRGEQQVVLTATRTPYKVNWPDWWDADLRDRK